MTHITSFAVRWLDRIAAVDAAAWNALAVDDHPFTRHEFLDALEQSGSQRAELGWQAQHLTLWSGEKLVGAAPGYLKSNSHGEFVFDWHWAAAYERGAQRYYPKLLCAVPYTPVTGPRLLAAGTGSARTEIQTRLIQALTEHCNALQLSGAHLNFIDADSASCAAFADSAWLARFDWQFHWTQSGYRDFADFLDALSAKKRKNIRQERARVERSGCRIERLRGDQLDSATLQDIYGYYADTFRAKGNLAALTPEFFALLLRRMPNQVLAIVATRGGRRVAAAFCLQSATTLYGRYWGCSEDIAGLHFECCYYQGIEHCIAQGLTRFEPGAQGEHKIARGFLPTRTRSFHYLREPNFRAAVADYLGREAADLERYAATLREHSPFAD